MKTISVISLSIFLAACGGSSSSTSDEKPVASSTSVATFEKALKDCGENIELSISDHTVSGTGEDFKLIPEKDAILNIEGVGHDICINGGMGELSIEGSGHDVYVSEGVSTLVIQGTGHDVYVFGDVLSIELSGSGHDVWVKSVATYSDTGENNDVMNISNAKL